MRGQGSGRWGFVLSSALAGVVVGVICSGARAQSCDNPPWPQEYVCNGGFEEGLAPYCPGSPAYWRPNVLGCAPEIYDLTTSTKMAGDYSLHLRAHTTWDWGGLRQVSPYNSVTEGRSYLVRAWIKTANVQNPAGWFAFGVEGMNNDVVVAESKMPQQETVNYDWRLIEWVVDVPVGLGINRLATVLTRHTDGDVWYDDISISEIPDEPFILVSRSAITQDIMVGTALAEDTFTVRNGGVGTMAYTISDDAAWLWCTPTDGDSSGEDDTITVHYASSGLPPGVHSAVITVTAPDAINSPLTIPVSVHAMTQCDFDGDEDVDLTDFGFFLFCYNGPNKAPNSPTCDVADFDSDGDVDLGDYAVFLGCYNGPARWAAVDCSQ
jgi:hypothetical protein